MSESEPAIPRSAPISTLSRFLIFFGSVRFGIVLLVAISVLSLVGMMVVQQNVQGFAAFYGGLSPAQRSVYSALGLFDVYHSWYYTALLGALALNIILSSVDRFPSTWKLATRPILALTPERLRAWKFSHGFECPDRGVDQAELQVISCLQKCGWRRVKRQQTDSGTVLFAQRGAWNRFGAYAVHLALLLIIFGGFVTSRFARNGETALRPGSSSRQITTLEATVEGSNRVTMLLPFEIYCRDISQKLIDRDGPITAPNTLDWVTEITIKDEGGETNGTVSLNSPFDYRGYRIFHSSIVPLGRARVLEILVTSDADGTQEKLRLPRSGSAELKDGTRIRFADFRAGFDMRNEDPSADTTDYRSPAALLEVTRPGGSPETVFAYGGRMAEMPVAMVPVGGYTFRILDFERVADQHILFVRRDPGATIVYAGFAGLAFSLAAVFLFSHRRIWVLVTGVSGGGSVILAAGDTNRHQDNFEKRFRKFTEELESALREWAVTNDRPIDRGP